MDRGLKAFLAVAKEGYITAAASKINLSQSSLTKRIAALNLAIGVSLFYRDSLGMSLTEAWQLFLLRAEQIEQEYRYEMEEIAIIRDAGISQLSVGAGPVFHMNWIASLFDELIKQFPNLKLELRTGDYSTIGEPPLDDPS